MKNSTKTASNRKDVKSSLASAGSLADASAQPPDHFFCDEIEATGNRLLWDPGAYGYAIYNIKGDIRALKDIAKKYGMKSLVL